MAWYIGDQGRTSHYRRWACWHVSVILAFRRWRQENPSSGSFLARVSRGQLGLREMLSHPWPAGLREMLSHPWPAKAAWDALSKKQNKNKTRTNTISQHFKSFSWSLSWTKSHAMMLINSLITIIKCTIQFPREIQYLIKKRTFAILKIRNNILHHLWSIFHNI